jgi:hypothetical protein
MRYQNHTDLSISDLLSLLPSVVRITGNLEQNTVIVDGEPLDLKSSLKVSNHSPTGFNWGYGGSGAAQFALALLMRYFPTPEAVKYYQKFKFGWVAGLPRNSFSISVNLKEIFYQISSQ